MGYSNPDWVSDYHFNRALDHRRAAKVFGGASAAASAPAAANDPETPPSQKTLLLWGGVGNDEFVLEPAFLLDGTPKLPQSGGPYGLEGFGVDGDRQFGFNFTPDPVEYGGGHFLFAVPYDPERDGALDRVVLSGPDRTFALRPGGTDPMAIIVNRDTGRVRAILRDWDGGFNLVDGATEIMVSDGLPGGAR